MKILQMCDVRWYNANAHYVIQLARGLAAAGHQVTLWAREGTPIVRKAEEAGLPVIRHRRGDPFKLLRLWWLVKRGDFDIVNAHRGPDLWLAMLLKILHSVSVVVTRSDIRPFRNNAANRYFFAQQVDAVILSGRFHLEQGALHAFDLPEECITVVPLGTEMLPVAPVTVTPRPFRLVMVGRFDPVKGHHNLLAAFRQALPEIPGAELGLIGYPASIDTAQLRAAAAGLPVRIIDRPVDIARELTGYQVGVVASNASEAVARAGLEYLSRGMPVIGTRINSIPELIQDGVNGLLVPPDDSVALARAILRLYREYPTFQTAVLATREQFALQGMVEHTLTVYRQVSQ